MRASYYNEIDPYAAQWLRNLIAEGHLPAGDVDERDIRDVQPDDVRNYIQCHFFAGIGGWAYAARLADWPESKPIWTGSCPCQPFSIAGGKLGVCDERHLWPAFHRLVAECRPTVVAGEQVASKDGRLWLAGIRTDLENSGYAVWAADLCAAGVSAPHVRQRLYWMAVTESEPLGLRGQPRVQPHSADTRMGVANGAGPSTWHQAASVVGYRRAADATGRDDPARLGDADRYHEHWWSGPVQVGWNGVEAEVERGGRRYRAQWRLKPGLPIVAHGVPNRVERLCAAGNAIVPQVGAEFLRTYLDCATI